MGIIGYRFWVYIGMMEKKMEPTIWGWKFRVARLFIAAQEG